MGVKAAFIVYASILHIIWATVLLFFPEAIRSSYMVVLLQMLKFPQMIIFTLIMTAVLAIIGLIYYRERRPFSIGLLLPQQFILWMIAFSAINELINGIPGISTDRLLIGFAPIILLAPIYTFSVFECSRGLSWSRHLAGESHLPH